MTSTARLLLRAVLIPFAALVCGWIGVAAGEFLPYRLAAFVDRDIAELKDLLIWSVIVHTALFAALGAWGVLVLTSAGRVARFIALGLAAFIAIAGIGIGLAGYPWPKDSGHPVVRYELRIPANSPEPVQGDGGYDLTIWTEKNGHGAYIAQVRRAVDRPEIKGDFVLYKDKLEQPTMSLRLRGMEGHWRVPMAGDAKLEKKFGEWQKIEFIPTPRAGVPPLPAGEYEIRYWVNHYL